MNEKTWPPPPRAEGGRARRHVEREELAALLRLWQDGTVGPAAVKMWIAEVESSDETVREALAELDLLEVYLLTRDDVPALLALVESDDAPRAVADWVKHRDHIDLDARSKQLKKDRFYRPFCR